MSRLRVMIVDDHRVVREGLQLALEIEENIEVVGEAGEGREAVGKAQELKPDLILMDVMMPGMNGIDACQEIRELFPETRVVMLTASSDQESVTSSLVAGAQGYVLKAASRDELLRALRAVGRGESILDPSVTRIVTEGFSRLKPFRLCAENRFGPSIQPICKFLERKPLVLTVWPRWLCPLQCLLIQYVLLYRHPLLPPAAFLCCQEP